MFNYTNKYLVSNGRLNEIWDFGINPVRKANLGVDFNRVDLMIGRYVYGIDIFGVPAIWDTVENSLVRYFKVYDNSMNLLENAILTPDLALSNKFCTFMNRGKFFLCKLNGKN